MTDIAVIGWLIAIGLLAAVILAFYVNRPLHREAASHSPKRTDEGGAGLSAYGSSSNDNCSPGDSGGSCDAGGGGDGGGGGGGGD